MVRGGQLPEDKEYQDTGCAPLAPECVRSLECPRYRCIYEDLEEHEPRVNRNRQRIAVTDAKAEHAWQMRKFGASYAGIARAMNVSQRTVWRLLRRAREQEEQAA